MSQAQQNMQAAENEAIRDCIIVPPSHMDELIHELEQLEGVIRLSVVPGAPVKPGDVLTVDALHREADERF